MMCHWASRRTGDVRAGASTPWRRINLWTRVKPLSLSLSLTHSSPVVRRLKSLYDDMDFKLHCGMFREDRRRSRARIYSFVPPSETRIIRRLPGSFNCNFMRRIRLKGYSYRARKGTILSLSLAPSLRGERTNLL
jgi:hypothetical protein